MCGRTACTLGPGELVRKCEAVINPEKSKKRKRPKWVENGHQGHEYKTSFNRAPGSISAVLVNKKYLQNNVDKLINEDEDDSICLFPMLWGLVPTWYDGHPLKTGLSTSNCRSEGMADKKMFSDSLRRGWRCVIVVDGFYEWKTTTVKKMGSSKAETKKQPYFIFASENKAQFEKFKENHNCDIKVETEVKLDLSQVEAPESSNLNKELQRDLTPSRLLTMAGLFSIRLPQNGDGCDSGHSLYSYSVITVPSSEQLQWLHHRQPAILQGEAEIRRWLSEGPISSSEIQALIRPVSDLSFYPVSTLVNHAGNNDEKCMNKIDLKAEEEKLKPKPTALTMWLAKPKAENSSTMKEGKSTLVKKEEKKENSLTSWLQGKRKSDPDSFSEDNKRTKN